MTYKIINSEILQEIDQEVTKSDLTNKRQLYLHEEIAI